MARGFGFILLGHGHSSNSSNEIMKDNTTFYFILLIFALHCNSSLREREREREGGNVALQGHDLKISCCFPRSLKISVIN